MKNKATYIKILFLINIPALHINNDINDAPSCSYCKFNFLGSKNTTPYGFFELEPCPLDI
jgi:hypothetical protein